MGKRRRKSWTLRFCFVELLKNAIGYCFQFSAWMFDRNWFDDCRPFMSGDLINSSCRYFRVKDNRWNSNDRFCLMLHVGQTKIEKNIEKHEASEMLVFWVSRLRDEWENLNGPAHLVLISASIRTAAYNMLMPARCGKRWTHNRLIKLRHTEPPPHDTVISLRNEM